MVKCLPVCMGGKGSIPDRQTTPNGSRQITVVIQHDSGVADLTVVELTTQHRTIQLPVESDMNMKIAVVCPIRPKTLNEYQSSVIYYL